MKRGSDYPGSSEVVLLPACRESLHRRGQRDEVLLLRPCDGAVRDNVFSKFRSDVAITMLTKLAI